MLEKESINLPEIISVIGDRPFPMKESIKNYLNEMENRAEKEAATKFAEDEEQAAEAAATSSEK